MNHGWFSSDPYWFRLRLAGPFILRPASELAFSKATGGKDEASTFLRGADHRDFEGGRSRREDPGGLPRERYFGTDVLPRARKFGGMEVSEAKTLRELERENSELKKMVADLSLDVRMLKALNSKKW